MIAYAAQKHDNQFDKGGQPYILHTLRVMNTLNTTEEELQCIAVGHDLMEDCGVTEEDLLRIGMTTRVIRGIKDLTKIKDQTHREYKERVKSNPDAIRVKIEDLVDNTNVRRLKGIEEKDMIRMKEYHEFYMELIQLI